MTPTPESLEALSNLREFSHYQWYIIPILVIVHFTDEQKCEGNFYNRVLLKRIFI